MNEQDGHAMLVARCKALEEIALSWRIKFAYETSTYFTTDEEHKLSLEWEIESLAPGCGHLPQLPRG